MDAEITPARLADRHLRRPVLIEIHRGQPFDGGRRRKRRRVTVLLHQLLHNGHQQGFAGSGFPDNRRIPRRFLTGVIPPGLAVVQVQVIPATAGRCEDGDGFPPRITAAFVGMEVMQAGYIGKILAADGHQSGSQRIHARQLRQIRGGQ